MCILNIIYIYMDKHPTKDYAGVYIVTNLKLPLQIANKHH